MVGLLVLVVVAMEVKKAVKNWLEAPQGNKTFVTYLSNPEDSSRLSVFWDTAEGFPQVVEAQSVQGTGSISTEAEVNKVQGQITTCLEGWLKDGKVAKACQDGVHVEAATASQYGLWGTIKAPTLAAAKNIIYNIDMVPDGLVQIS